MTSPAVSVIIPVLDPGPGLFDCLASIGADQLDVEVILFDNGSSDGSVAKALDLHPSIRVIREEENVGFAPACNRAAQMAAGEYLLFLNSDAVMGTGGLSRLLETARRDDAASIWQPVVLSPYGALENAGEYFTWSGFFIRRRDLPLSDAAPYPVFACTAACMLVRRRAFEELGGFNDDYFAYIEDVDLCWRARMAGWEVRVVPAVRVVHEKSVTTNLILSPLEKRALAYRNRLRTILANPSATTLARVLPLYLMSCLAMSLLFAVSGRLGSARVIVKSLWWPIRHRSAVRLQRTKARAIVKQSDRDVLRRDVVASFVGRAGWRLLADHYRT